MNNLDKYHELSFYTLSLKDRDFVHQHIVDAYTAQTANKKTKPIALFFSLAGLYLLIEKNFSGRQVQQAHQKMASKTKVFIKISLPENKGQISIADVLKVPEGSERNLMIKEWCLSVWNAYASQHRQVIEATNKLLFDNKAQLNS
jgi:hypothetical protein